VEEKHKKSFENVRVSECLLDIYLSGYDQWDALVQIVINP